MGLQQNRKRICLEEMCLNKIKIIKEEGATSQHIKKIKKRLISFLI